MNCITERVEKDIQKILPVPAFYNWNGSIVEWGIGKYHTEFFSFGRIVLEEMHEISN